MGDILAIAALPFHHGFFAAQHLNGAAIDGFVEIPFQDIEVIALAQAFRLDSRRQLERHGLKVFSRVNQIPIFFQMLGDGAFQHFGRRATAFGKHLGQVAIAQQAHSLVLPQYAAQATPPKRRPAPSQNA